MLKFPPRILTQNNQRDRSAFVLILVREHASPGCFHVWGRVAVYALSGGHCLPSCVFLAHTLSDQMMMEITDDWTHPWMIRGVKAGRALSDSWKPNFLSFPPKLCFQLSQFSRMASFLQGLPWGLCCDMLNSGFLRLHSHSWPGQCLLCWVLFWSKPESNFLIL